MTTAKVQACLNIFDGGITPIALARFGFYALQWFLWFRGLGAFPQVLTRSIIQQIKIAPIHKSIPSWEVS